MYTIPAAQQHALELVISELNLCACPSPISVSGMAAAGRMTLHRFLLCFVNER